jgi:hypothetical protein
MFYYANIIKSSLTTNICAIFFYIIFALSAYPKITPKRKVNIITIKTILTKTNKRRNSEQQATGYIQIYSF